MSKKTEKQKNEAYLAAYRETIRKIHALSKISTRQLIGSRPDGDPRLEYMTKVEAFMNIANVQIQVLLKLVTTANLQERIVLASREEFLKVSQEQVEAQLKTMEEDLGVTGWNGEGSPIFDLQAYAKRTAGWPK